MRRPSTIDTIIVHHSASKASVTIGDIDQWHFDRGFRRTKKALKTARPELRSIGYHYVINEEGTSFAGRALEEKGAHCPGSNLRSVAICLIGNGTFTRDQWETLRWLVTTLQGALNRKCRVVGHRDAARNDTQCPGFDVATWWTTKVIPAEALR